MKKQPNMDFPSRKQFFWFFSTLIRNTIVDQIRAKTSLRRQAKNAPNQASLQFQIFGFRNRVSPQTLLDLDRALKRLAGADARQCRIVEGHFFAGLTMAELADLEDISMATVKRDLRFAKKWLARQMYA